MTKVKHSSVTWLKCKIVIVQVLQRRIPLEESCALICMQTAPSISQACCGD